MTDQNEQSPHTDPTSALSSNAVEMHGCSPQSHELPTLTGKHSPATTAAVMSPHDGVGLPASFAPAVWSGHAGALLRAWLNDFTWHDVPIANWIDAVDVSFGRRRPVQIWAASRPPQRHIPPPGSPPTWLWDETLYSMWHPAWPDLVEAWNLRGRWLHPETRFQIDQLLFAENAASLLIGCVDRDDPSAPRRYDPALEPDVHDIGVIAFPLFPHRALAHSHAGHTPDTAMLLCAGTAIIEAAVHESLETFQTRKGIPILDPHNTPFEVTAHITWASDISLTTGGSATNRDRGGSARTPSRGLSFLPS